MRAARTGSLTSTLVEVLNEKGKLPVAEATEAAKAAGYKSKPKDFQNILGMTFSQSTHFKRVGRGGYGLGG